MNNSHLFWIGRYEGALRQIAKNCKTSPLANEQAGRIIAPFIPDGSIIVPMPEHNGKAMYTLEICKEIERCCNSYDSGLAPVKLVDCLKCKPHESSYIQKMNGLYPLPMEMYLSKEISYAGIDIYGKNVIIIDNVIVTGETARAALNVLPNATVFALCNDTYHR